jgi:hypothetical protein
MFRFNGSTYVQQYTVEGMPRRPPPWLSVSESCVPADQPRHKTPQLISRF